MTVLVYFTMNGKFYGPSVDYSLSCHMLYKIITYHSDRSFGSHLCKQWYIRTCFVGSPFV